MKPEEIDKLFGERLRNAAPTPPVNLWNRLQERMEEELPQEKEEKRGGFFMWVNNFAAAAAVTLLLSVGGAVYMMQDDKPGKAGEAVQGVAQTEVKEQPLPVLVPTEADPAIVPEQAEKIEKLAAIPEANEKALQETATVLPGNASPKGQAIAKAWTGKASSKKEAADTPTLREEPQPEPLHALAISTADINGTDAAMSAVPLQIVIKRSSEPVANASETYTEATEAASEDSGFDKKRRLAKNILKQVVNLSNGERVELSEIGINANKIALETQIGNQKISKIIHL